MQDGQKTEPDPVTFEGPGANCMDRTLPSVEKFFEGTAQPAEIKETFDCLTGALQTFETHVRGENRDRYSAQELRRFIEYFFLKESKITDALLTEVMRLKQTILGGQLESLTREELKQVYVVLNTLRDEAVKLAPYMRIMTLAVPKPGSAEERTYIEQGIIQITGSARAIGSLLGRSQNAYLLTDLETLLREFGKLFHKGDEPWEGPEELIKNIPLISALKSFFLRPTGSAIAPDEWQELVAKAARLYSLYLRADLLFPQEMTSGEGLRQVVQFSSDVFGILEESVRIKDNKMIEFREIDNLIEQIYKLEKLKLPVTKSTAHKTVHAFFEKVMNPMSGGSRPNVYGITDRGLQWLKRDVYGWQEVQGLWNTLSRGAEAIDVDTLRVRWAEQRMTYDDVGEELTHLINKSFPLVYRGHDNVVLERPVGKMRIDERHWTSLNWKRFLIRWAMRGYVSDFATERFTGITKPVFKVLWDDITPVLFELEVLKETDYDLWTTTFDEANIFLLSADGNVKVSFAEGMEALSFILSGSRIAVVNFESLKAKCKEVAQDQYGSPKLDITCSRDMIKKNYKTFYANSPYWVEMMSKFDDKMWKEFLDNMFIAARGEEQKDEPVETGNMVKTNVIFSYIESLFLRFDADNSRTLSVKESQMAYPLLRDILKEMSGFEKEDEIMALFTYLIRYGEAPDKNLKNKLLWLLWKGQKNSWKYEADRQQLLRVVSNL